MMREADEYDERCMFGPLFPLVAAFPTVAAIRAVLQTTSPLAGLDLPTPPAGHALRRRTSAAWSRDNAYIIRIPDELLDLHDVESAEIFADPPSPSSTASMHAPLDEHRDAQLCLMRRRVEVDPITWATVVASTTEQQMIVVAEHTNDWAPWSPMLVFALQLRQIDPECLAFRAAAHRLRLVGRRLLDAMTMTDVRVDDTLGLPLPMQRATIALFESPRPR